MPARRELRAVLHSIRTPLNSILLWTRLLKDQGLTLSERTRGLDVLETSGMAIAGYVDEISTLAETRVETCDLPALARSALESLKETAERSGTELIAPDTSGASVRADPVRLAEMLRGLLAHALEDCASGSAVRLGIVPRAADVLVLVENGSRSWSLSFPRA